MTSSVALTFEEASATSRVDGSEGVLGLNEEVVHARETQSGDEHVGGRLHVAATRCC
jgi:hypothetical protein